MTDLFESPKLTLARARHHIRDLERCIAPLQEEDARTYVVEKDEEGFNIHKVRFTRRLPKEASCILFDAANNLRAALDQAGYAATCASGKPGSKKTSFPFAESKTQLGESGQSKHLPKDIFKLFRSFKPYREEGNKILWAMNRLCNTKKHCTLVPISIGPGQISLGASSETGLGGLDHTFQTAWDAEHHEIKLMRATPEVRFSLIGMTIAVAVQSVDVLRKRPLIEVLDQLSDMVERIILATEAECKRNGWLS